MGAPYYCSLWQWHRHRDLMDWRLRSFLRATPKLHFDMEMRAIYYVVRTLNESVTKINMTSTTRKSVSLGGFEVPTMRKHKMNVCQIHSLFHFTCFVAKSIFPNPKPLSYVLRYAASRLYDKTCETTLVSSVLASWVETCSENYTLAKHRNEFICSWIWSANIEQTENIATAFRIHTFFQCHLVEIKLSISSFRFHTRANKEQPRERNRYRMHPCQFTHSITHQCNIMGHAQCPVAIGHVMAMFFTFSVRSINIECMRDVNAFAYMRHYVHCHRFHCNWPLDGSVIRWCMSCWVRNSLTDGKTPDFLANGMTFRARKVLVIFGCLKQGNAIRGFRLKAITVVDSNDRQTTCTDYLWIASITRSL